LCVYIRTQPGHLFTHVYMNAFVSFVDIHVVFSCQAWSRGGIEILLGILLESTSQCRKSMSLLGSDVGDILDGGLHALS
jgi:hypothetical protein